MQGIITISTAEQSVNSSSGGEPFLEISFDDNLLWIKVWPGREEPVASQSKLWSQTAYEFQVLAASIGVLAENKIQTPINVPAKDILIGPKITVWPSLTCELGHPGFNHKETGTSVFISRPWKIGGSSDLINFDIIQGNFGASAQVSLEESLRFIDFLNHKAKELASKYVPSRSPLRMCIVMPCFALFNSTRSNVVCFQKTGLRKVS